MKSIKKIIITSVAVVVLLRTGLFCHLTLEMLISGNLFFNGHFINAFTTNVHKTEIDSQYGQLYTCKNPTIGPSHYAFIKKKNL